MKRKFIIGCFLCALLAAACTHRPKKITDACGTPIVIDAAYDAQPDSLVSAIVAKYKEELNERLYEVVGKSAREMSVRRPESLLSNFTADAILSVAKEKIRHDIDFSLINFGGIRTDMPSGDITVYDLYSIYPFENKLAILTIDGKTVRELFDFFAANRMEAMSNVYLYVNEKKVSEATINGKPLDDNQTYTLVTLDFIAQGGDGMNMLSKASNYESTELLLRDVMEEYIRSYTAKGKMIDSKIDGRIKIL